MCPLFQLFGGLPKGLGFVLLHLDCWWNKHSLDACGLLQSNNIQGDGLLWLAQFIIIRRKHITWGFFYGREGEEWGWVSSILAFQTLHRTDIYLSWLWVLIGNQLTLDAWWLLKTRKNKTTCYSSNREFTVPQVDTRGSKRLRGPEKGASMPL